MAALSAGRFSVLTTLSISVPVISDIEAQGFGRICDGVYASGVPVLDLENAPDKSSNIVATHLQKIAINSPSNSVILGCAGMTNIWSKLQPKLSNYLDRPSSSSGKASSSACLIFLGSDTRDINTIGVMSRVRL